MAAPKKQAYRLTFAINKKKPNKQHDLRGASFVRLAKRLRELAIAENINLAEPSVVIQLIANCLEAEGKAASRMR